jgi:tetratricopeptide (TPR) repeat protein
VISLKVCPNCKAEAADANATFCSKCGASLTDQGEAQATDNTPRDDLDFVVTEATADDRDFVGGKNEFAESREDLGIESTSDLMEKEAQSYSPDALDNTDARVDLGPIGDSSPPLPPQADVSDQSQPPVQQEKSPAAPTGDEPASGEIKRLSPEEVKSIEKNLYGENNLYLSDKDKTELARKINGVEEPFGAGPIEPPKKRKPKVPATLKEETASDLPPPTMSKRGRGIAYYFRNFIQVAGSQEILPNDELVIGNRSYELRPKHFNTKIGIGAAIGLFAIILFLVGSQFISDAGSGQGEIVGVVLDESGRPFLQGATVRLPDLGKTFRTNPQGFFRTGTLPEGTHKLEYVVEGKILGDDYATISGGKLTLLSLSPDSDRASAGEAASHGGSEKVASQQQKLRSQAETDAPARKAETTTAARTAKKSSAKKSGDKYARVALNANVEDARLEIDGSVLGAGNLTYSKIKPGKHKYRVSKDGYQPFSGTVSLQPGQKKTLKVELLPSKDGPTTAVRTAEDWYATGYALVKEQEFSKAIEAFSKAVEMEPSYAEVYFYRGEAHTRNGDNAAAHDDFVRAAEIYQFRKEYNWSVTSYNRAIELDEKSITALLGRGRVHLIKGEERAAIADFEDVLKSDKKNAQAYMGLGEGRFQQGNYKKAIKYFKEARSLDGRNPLVYQWLMLAYLARDDEKNVRKSFDKFREYASESQYQQLLKSEKYAGVLQIVDLE